jgi:RimJ/RimL family protein N-acetyltransferase
MIIGKYIGLRALEVDDLPILQNWRNNNSMRRYYREYRELSLADQESWYKTICINNRNFCMFGIVSLYDTKKIRHIRYSDIKKNQLIGVCGLTNINWIIRASELSFYIGAHDIYVDKYFAYDVVHVICDYAFNILNMNKVWAEIYEFDVQKKILFEAMNMHLDGILRNNVFDSGKYYDSFLYSLLSSEFK